MTKKAKAVETTNSIELADNEAIAVDIVKQSELIVGKAAIEIADNKLFKTETDAMRDRQIVAMSILQHSIVHGDITMIVPFLERTPKNIRRDAMAAWFERYGCVDFIKDEESGKYVATYSKEKREALKKNGWYENAAKHWWYQTTKQKDYTPFIDSEKMESFISSLEKRAAKKLGDDVIHPELIKELKALHNKYLVAAVTSPSEEKAA